MKLKSAAGVVAFIIVLVLIGLGFYYVVSLKTTQTQPKDAKSNQTFVPNKIKVTASPKDDVADPVEAAYNTYLKDMKAGKTDEALATFKKSTTSELAAKLDRNATKDPILCTKDLPAKLDFTHPPLMGLKTVINITAVSAAGKKTYISVTGDVNTKKLEAIKCAS